jgi:diguanylate cyclase
MKSTKKDELQHLQTLLKESNDQVASLTRHDPQTGLFLRAAFTEIFSQQLMIASREHMPLSLAMINIDHLQAFNATHGKASGDQALIHIANTLRFIARDSDILGRLEGEAFIVLMFNTDHKEAQHAAERFRAGVEDLVLPNDNRLTVSVGSATFGEKSIAGIDLTPSQIYAKMHARAEDALKRAKEHGGNMVCF